MRQRDVFSPTATTSPAISRPRTFDAPCGGGYSPLRCMMSGPFTPAYATFTTTCFGAAVGGALSASARFSGPPGADSATYFIDDGNERLIRVTPRPSAARFDGPREAHARLPPTRRRPECRHRVQVADSAAGARRAPVSRRHAAR